MMKRTLVSSLLFPLMVGISACSDDEKSAAVDVKEPATAIEEAKVAVKEKVQEVKDTVSSAAEKAAEETPAATTDVAEVVTTPEVVEEPVEEVVTPAKKVVEEVAEAPAAAPTNHEVKAAVTKFSPMVLFINPGDTVTWTNMAGHDTTSIDGMIPEGAEKWQSKMGEQFSHTFTVEGAYIYKCTPHASLGMISAVVVGSTTPANLDAIKAMPENKGMIGRTIRKLDKALTEKNK